MVTGPAGTVVIVGAGVVGMSCALFLQKQGFRVTVIDRVGPGESCSYGNASGLAFPEIVPISRPGLIAKVPKWLFDPKGPLSIRPAYLPRLMPWLVRFASAGRPARVRALARAAADLSRAAKQDLDVLLAMLGAQDMVFGEFCAAIYDHHQQYLESKWAWDLRAEHGFPSTRLSGPEFHELEPDVSPDVGCAVVMEGWRNLTDPYRFVVRIAEHVQRAGGQLVVGEVRRVDITDRTVRTLHLADGSVLTGDHFVIAAGAWSHRLARQLGSKVPLEADRGYNKTMPGAGLALKRQLVYEPAGIAITPLPKGLRIGGAVEFAGVDAAPDYRRADHLVERARRILPGLNDTSGERWMGPRPGLPDFLPVISGSPHFANAFYAFGHGHLGLTWAPASGRLVADLISRKPIEIDMAPFRIDRFARGRPSRSSQSRGG